MVDKAIGVILAIIAVASLAVVLSKKSNTAKVVGTVSTGVNNLIKTAVSPITKS